VPSRPSSSPPRGLRGAWIAPGQLAVLSVPLRSDGDDDEWPELTPTEREVARLAVAGLPNREIAQRRHVSRPTVARQLSAIYAKLGVSSRAALAALFIRRQAAVDKE